MFDLWMTRRNDPQHQLKALKEKVHDLERAIADLSATLDEHTEWVRNALAQERAMSLREQELSSPGAGDPDPYQMTFEHLHNQMTSRVGQVPYAAPDQELSGYIESPDLNVE